MTVATELPVDITQIATAIATATASASATATTSRGLHVDDPVAEFGNCWGHIALWSSSLFLWTVTQRGVAERPSSRGWNGGGGSGSWNANSAYHYFHIWPGRVVVLASILHGSVHLYRWKYRLGLSWFQQLVPPRRCWTELLQQETPSEARPVLPNDCHGLDIMGCTCYDIFRNGIGWVAWVGMMVIGLTSIEWVRRRYYGVFYMSHIIVSPLILVCTCLHFTRAIIYIAPSVLYYVAYSMPIWCERLAHARRRGKLDRGVRIISWERIVDTHCDDHGNRSCINLIVSTTEEAWQCYQPGQHVKIRAPAVSCLSHPFTANRITRGADDETTNPPHHHPLLQILFRETGNFTTRLSELLRHDETPVLWMHGFYGSPSRLTDALQHDTIIFVAGGIGIVTYLSLLSSLTCTPVATKPLCVVLHWICREASLIEFVQREHLNALVSSGNDSTQLHIHIYYTGEAPLSIPLSKPDDTPYTSDNNVECQATIERNTRSSKLQLMAFETGQPFAPLTFDTLRDTAFPYPLWVRIGVYGCLNGVGGSMVTWYACTHALHEADPAATVWSWVCSFAIAGSILRLSFTMTLGPFVAVSSTIWVGHLVIWFVYVNYQDEFSRAAVRLVSPLAVAVIAALVTLLYTCIPVGNNRPAKYSLVNLADDADGTEMVEARRRLSLDGPSNNSVSDKHSFETSRTSVNIVSGRPDVPSLLRPPVGAQSVGVFSCGPVDLMQDVRSTVRSLRGGACCRSGQPLSISLYEESFET